MGLGRCNPASLQGMVQAKQESEGKYIWVDVPVKYYGLKWKSFLAPKVDQLSVGNVSAGEIVLAAWRAHCGLPAQMHSVCKMTDVWTTTSLRDVLRAPRFRAPHDQNVSTHSHNIC